MKRKLALVALAGFAGLFTSCTVGPNYRRPPVPTSPTYRGPENAAVSTPESLGDEKWWAVFKDPVLQGLIRTALNQNFDVQIAATRILQAQAQVVITRANQLPTVSGGPGISGVRQPGIPGVFSGYSYLAADLTASASWNLDFWGKYRRATEAARANLSGTEWGRRAVISTLVENVATV